MSSVQSVERAFDVLHSLRAGPAGVSELAARTGLPKSTVSRLLSTLVDLGAVERGDAPGVYGLGDLLVELSAAASPRRSLLSAARPHLESLSTATGEAAGLSILDGTSVRYLDQVDAPQEIHVRDWTGECIDAHAVPSGLVMLAYGPAAPRDALFAGTLRRWTDRTVTDPARLARRLEEVRRAGVAWGCEELVAGLASVAAPIVGSSGAPVAAVHVHAPSYRFPDARGADETAAVVVEAADRISARLGAERGGEAPAGGATAREPDGDGVRGRSPRERGRRTSAPRESGAGEHEPSRVEGRHRG